MTKQFNVRFAALLAVGFCLLLRGPFAAAQPTPQDVVTVGSAIGPAGTTVDVPVFIRDTSGTPLGMDQPPGSKIQSYSIKVNYAPAASVQSITFTRAGITQSELAVRAGMSQAAISRLERGERSLTVEALERLLLVMGQRLELRTGPLPRRWRPFRSSAG